MMPRNHACQLPLSDEARGPIYHSLLYSLTECDDIIGTMPSVPREITGIREFTLRDSDEGRKVGIALRMSWAAYWQTGDFED